MPTLSPLRRMATFRRSGILGSSPAAPQKAFPRREPPRCQGSRLLAKHHKYMGKTVVIMSFLSESRKSAPQPLSSPVLFSLHTPSPKDPVLVVKGCGLKLSEAPHPSAARPAPRAPPQDGRGGGWAAPSHPPGSSGTRSPTPRPPPPRRRRQRCKCSTFHPVPSPPPPRPAFVTCPRL